jgi:hypothetical protein
MSAVKRRLEPLRKVGNKRFNQLGLDWCQGFGHKLQGLPVL